LNPDTGLQEDYFLPFSTTISDFRKSNNALDLIKILYNDAYRPHFLSDKRLCPVDRWTMLERLDDSPIGTYEK
jgi:hypothetical protein